MNNSIHIREYLPGDEGRGLAACLAFFSPDGQPDMAAGERLAELLAERASMGFPVFVAVEAGEVLGTAGCHTEPKLIHGGCRAGFIEDVAVRQDRRGQGIGEALVEHCLSWLSSRGCYKATLECGREVSAFYEKCGLYHNGLAMRADL
jgi:GNAT superfamily N-acetyltransferase